MGLFKSENGAATNTADVIDKMERELGTVVALRAAERPVVRKREPPSEYKSAYWLRSMRYEEMMIMAGAMHSVKGDEPIETPEQLAAWLIRWARAAQEQYDVTEAERIDQS